MTDSRLPELAEKIATGVRTIIGEIRPKLIEAALSGHQGERKNVRHADNFLSEHDIWMHQRYRELLQDILPSFLYTSEEGDPERVGEDADPDLCVLVDPLDTSELAVRGLHGYTHILIYSRTLSRPVVAVVGDIFHQIQLYIGARNEHGHDEAFVITADGNLRPIKVTDSPELKDALVTNYLMRPAERFAPLAGQQGFLAALGAPAEDGRQRGRIGVGYGSVSLCHVATGQTDAMVEFAKGFATWDLYPGHYILEAAGGVVLDLQGDPIPLEGRLGSKEQIAKAMNERQEFVATATVELANEIISTLDLKRG
jgi:myo-inositol-1(or 4)-monophosphatase